MIFRGALTAMADFGRSAIALVLVIMSVGLLNAQQPTYKPGEFPAPRYPKIRKNATVDDLMPIARAIVKRVDTGALFYPGYNIKPGEKALIVVAPDYDPIVLAAIKRAIQEAGGKADVLFGSDAYLPGGDGAKEWSYFTYINDILKAETGGIDQPTQVRIALAGKYSIGLSGDGGGLPDYPKDKMRWAFIPWGFVDQFLVNGNGLPPELLKFIDDTAWSLLDKTVSVRATDPEGTDISWPNLPEYWEKPETHIPGHLMTHPRWGWSKAGLGGATGVLSGTWNHTGPFPLVRVTFKDDHIQGIEGGGAYGQAWREVKDRYKEVTWPTKEGEGLFAWLYEAAIGTNPKSIRSRDAMTRATGNVWERSRSGIIHWGIGAGSSDAVSFVQPQLGNTLTSRYFKEHPDTPTGHVHIHNYFLTMVLTKANGEKVPFVNKGHLVALDDPRVRQEAAKYGDPDELLREDWIPAIPGINVPGDYVKDYASDPAAYTRKDLKNWPY